MWIGATHDECPAGWPDAVLSRGVDITTVTVSDCFVTNCCRGDAIVIDWTDGIMAIDEPSSVHCCAPCDTSTHTLLEDAVVSGDPVHAAAVPESGDGDHQATPDQTTAGDAVVVHAPTIVLGTPSTAAAGRGAQTARPAERQPQAAAQEPLPELRPATAAAAKDQPVPASLDLPAEPPAPTRADAMNKPNKPSTEALPQPAPDAPAETSAKPTTPAVDELAVSPRLPAPANEPREENLFDEFMEDETEEGPATPADPTDEPEMTEEGTNDASDKDDSTAEGDAAATASTLVPDEPLRHWTDATGDHHAQGWLVEIRADEARILKVNGRHTTMALADLSASDQEYVAAVADRLAEATAATAPANDTAGL